MLANLSVYKTLLLLQLMLRNLEYGAVAKQHGVACHPLLLASYTGCLMNGMRLPLLSDYTICRIKSSFSQNMMGFNHAS